jgi:hypothetical protein
LREQTAALTRRADLPDDDPGPAESKLVERLAGEKPAAEGPGNWQIHEFGGPFPMVVGTRTDTPSSAGRKLAILPRRVVTWGLGIPSAENGWTLYTFHCGRSSEPLLGLSELPVPPGAAKTLTLRMAGGGALVAFQGPQEAESWKQFFEQWFHRRGWNVGDWCKTGSSWHLGGRGGVGRESVTVDVQFGPKSEGRLTGLFVAAPVRAQIEKDTPP